MSDPIALTFNFPAEVLSLLQRPKEQELVPAKFLEELKQELRKQNSPWMTYEEAADYARVSESTIIRLCEASKLKRHRIGADPRIHKDELNKAMGFEKL